MADEPQTVSIRGRRDPALQQEIERGLARAASEGAPPRPRKAQPPVKPARRRVADGQAKPIRQPRVPKDENGDVPEGVVVVRGNATPLGPTMGVYEELTYTDPAVDTTVVDPEEVPMTQHEVDLGALDDAHNEFAGGDADVELLEGDIVVLKLTLEIPSHSGTRNYYSYGVQSRVAPGESGEDAFYRVAEHVEKRVHEIAVADASVVAETHDVVDQAVREREASRQITPRPGGARLGRRP